ncbi:serine/threonine protein phosphatase [Desulfomarina profundi]|uniref:Serine/threonine protein phosphatase n=1 Tax=Desulfomarina profundi TaxID=2772557 RepID=A0A8D5FEP2_9BACT|nr:metallophosphoesterase [Desulfomarina profundi]BCL59311.1 serine/threonine protein phosphatase [Desulfomarina profundi]
MKIIAFGDIHMATSRVGTIPEIEKADLILLTGDLTNHGSESDVRKVLDEIITINPRILALFGNLDRKSVNTCLDQLDINLHGQARLIGSKLLILGVGGSNPTPFNTPSEFSEKELATLLQGAWKKGSNLLQQIENDTSNKIPTILVSHPPPYNTTTDRVRSGRHVGSKAVRTFIEQHQPDICITGHIHESKGADRIGNTRIYNPGMLQHGGWVTLYLKHSQLHVTLQ